MTWLDCESLIVKGKKMVERLKCKICLKYKSRLVTCKYFSDRWIVGAESLRTSNVRDHAHSKQHSNAMSLFKKQRAEDEGLGPSSYAPIAQSFSNLAGDVRERLRHKFDIAYFIAIEKLRSILLSVS